MSRLTREFIRDKLDEGVVNIAYKLKTGLKVHRFADDASLPVAQFAKVHVRTVDPVISRTPPHNGYVLVRMRDKAFDFWCLMSPEAVSEFQHFTGSPLSQTADGCYVQVHVSLFYFLPKPVVSDIVHGNTPIQFPFRCLVTQQDSNEVELVPVFEADRCVVASFSSSLEPSKIPLESVTPRAREGLIRPFSSDELNHLRSRARDSASTTARQVRMPLVKPVNRYFLSPPYRDLWIHGDE